MAVWMNALSEVDRPRARARVAGWATWPARRALLAAGRRAVASALARSDARASAHLSSIVDAFLGGYVAALRTPAPVPLAACLNARERPLRGFAFEGASMALALMDTLLPGSAGRLAAFVDGPASPHLYMACVGAGWAAARLHLPPDRARHGLDPLLGWLAVDGYGFHDAFCDPDLVVRRRMVPARVAGYAARVFDQGVGRALWFVESADVSRISGTIRDFPSDRRADLWSGVALAATYAGGVSIADLETLRIDAALYGPEMAQGAAFAAEARLRAENLVPHTEAACRVFAGRTAEELSWVVRELRTGVADVPGLPAYEQWRQRIGARLCGERV